VSLAFVNAFSTIWAIRLQTFFTFCKVCALIVVIIVGAVQLGKGGSHELQILHLEIRA